ncbi:MAG TPA: PAS domain-containing protein [Kofleriaceae bacterium]
MPTEVERLRKGMRLLSSAIATFTEATADQHRLLSEIAKQASEVINDTCVILLRDGDDLLPAAIWDPDPKLRADFVIEFSKPLGVTRDVILDTIQTGETRLLPHIELDQLKDRPAGLYALYQRIGLRGSLAVPMRVRGTYVGVISILRHRPERRVLDELDVELAQDIANHAGLAIANAQLVQQLREHDALKRAQEEAVRANRFLDAIIENIPDMVFVKDADRLAFTRFNRAGEKLLGVPRTDLIGKSDYDMFPPEEAKHFQAKDRATLESGQMVEIAEEPIHTQTGQRWLHTKKVPILDEQGIPRFLLGISHDITEAKANHAALVAAKERAEAANKELESFSYSVAHDLRSPLRGIDGFAQALSEDYADKLDDAGQRYLQRVREAAQRMALLIDDLLALSRVTRAEFVPQRVDLSSIATSVLSSLARTEPDRSVETVIEPALMTDGDPRLIAIAFENLLGNAWKFTSKTPNARIHVGRAEGRYFVRDNGAGFDQQFAHKLFGTFQRLHSENEFPGTGIGLATVARIIERHRGRVWAEGTPGEGATFYFTLNEPEAV